MVDSNLNAEVSSLLNGRIIVNRELNKTEPMKPSAVHKVSSTRIYHRSASPKYLPSTSMLGRQKRKNI